MADALDIATPNRCSMDFEEWLSGIIKSKSINLSEMSRKLEISYRSVYNSLFNKGIKRELRSSELIAICEYVGIDPMDFIDDRKR